MWEKVISFLVIFLFVANFAIADVDIIVTLTDEEYKAMEWRLISPEDWVIHAAKNQARMAGDLMVLELSDKRSDKITKEEAKDLIKNSTLKTRVEREADIEAKKALEIKAIEEKMNKQKEEGGTL